MSYQPFLIANYATGLDREVEPWLLPDDAWFELFDGFVYRGVTNKRDGYSGYANGLKSSYVESRIVHSISFGYSISGAIDGVNDTYVIQLTLPVIPGSITITGSNPVQVVTDDGAGNLVGAGTGTVNYVSGVINLVFTAPPAVASTITVVYGNFAIGNGTAGPYSNTIGNVPIARGSITITAGAQSATDTGVVKPNGHGTFVTVPAGGTGDIDYTTGIISVTFNAVVAVGVPITISYSYHPGLPVMGVMRFYPNSNVPEMIVADTDYVNRYDRATDRLVDISPATPYTGDSQDFWSWVNYQDASSNPRLLFANGAAGDVIQQWDGTTVTDYVYTSATITTLNARQLFEFQDRLILFQTYENGTFFPRRIRVSGFGANCDVFDTTVPGAGVIDIPDNTFFFGAAFNRDDLMFFTESSTWLLKYTSNDVNPFQLKKIDGSRGSKAAFSVISYLNRTMAASPRGLIMADGYTVNRMDNNLPDFTFNNINNQFFESCYSGFIDEDRDVYMLYPSKDPVRPALVAPESSDRILVANFEEDNYAIYRLPLSCMGNFEISDTILWSDLSAAKGFNNWDDLAAKYESWNAFPYSRAVPVAIGGGHKGEIWKLTDNEVQDNPQPVRTITIVAGGDQDRLQVTTDWNNYEVGDYIFFNAIQGMTELNNKQGFIESITTPFNTFVVKMGVQTTNFSAYTGGGTASRSVPFEALTKKLNPFINLDKKLKCGWIYFYVSCTKTLTTVTNEDDEEIQETAFLDIDVFLNDYKNVSEPNFSYKVDLSSLKNDEDKKWVKIWINQVSKFLQFRISNHQAGTKIKVHAMMPGLLPTGRLI